MADSNSNVEIATAAFALIGSGFSGLLTFMINRLKIQHEIDVKSAAHDRMEIVNSMFEVNKDNYIRLDRIAQRLDRIEARMGGVAGPAPSPDREPGA